MDTSYWSDALRRRISRRRALLKAAWLSAGTAALVACGGGPVGRRDTSGLLTQPVDTTKQAVKGGILTGHLATNPPALDPNTNAGTALHTVTAHTYTRLLYYKPGTVFDPPDGSVGGDVASAWEISPDGQVVTMKLRPNNKFDPRPPTNSRPVTVEDIRWSFDRYARLSPGRGDLLNSVSPDAPLESLSFPDASTIVVKLAFPFSGILRLLAFRNLSWHIMPAEAEDKFDFRQEMRGTGPWMLTKAEPSVRYEFRRNPNWWGGPDRPFLDGIDYPIIPETSTLVAQFQAKRIWGPYAPGGDQVLNLKRGSPELQMTATSPLLGNGSQAVMLSLSKLDASPLNQDVRLRQAISMLIDRDAAIDAFSNVSGFEKEGIPMETGWHTHAPSSWSGIWLDPKTNKLGEVSRYLHYNPDAAAKLLRAAGKFGMETDFSINSQSNNTVKRNLEAIAQMLQQGGHFKLNVQVLEYNTIFQPKYIFGHAQFEGIAGVPYGSWPDFDMLIWSLFSPKGRNDMVGPKPNQKIQDIMVRHRRELDDKRRISLAHDWQRAMVEDMPAVPYPGEATTFSLTWPWLANATTYQGWTTHAASAETWVHWWHDKSKDTSG